MTKKVHKKERKQSAIEDKLDDVLVCLTVIAERLKAPVQAQQTSAAPQGLPWATVRSAEPAQSLASLAPNIGQGFAQDSSQLADPYMATGVKRPEDL